MSIPKVAWFDIDMKESNTDQLVHVQSIVKA
jgi:hypothetical protein